MCIARACYGLLDYRGDYLRGNSIFCCSALAASLWIVKLAICRCEHDGNWWGVKTKWEAFGWPQVAPLPINGIWERCFIIICIEFISLATCHNGSAQHTAHRHGTNYPFHTRVARWLTGWLAVYTTTCLATNCCEVFICLPPRRIVHFHCPRSTPGGIIRCANDGGKLY